MCVSVSGVIFMGRKKNFNAKDYSDEEVERFKLEDAINIHEDTRKELDLYARTNNVKQVKRQVIILIRLC